MTIEISEKALKKGPPPCVYFPDPNTTPYRLMDDEGEEFARSDSRSELFYFITENQIPLMTLQ